MEREWFRLRGQIAEEAKSSREHRKGLRAASELLGRDEGCPGSLVMLMEVWRCRNQPCKTEIESGYRVEEKGNRWNRAGWDEKKRKSEKPGC